jgi:hypothetical protein
VAVAEVGQGADLDAAEVVAVADEVEGRGVVAAPCAEADPRQEAEVDGADVMVVVVGGSVASGAGVLGLNEGQGVGGEARGLARGEGEGGLAQRALVVEGELVLACGQAQLDGPPRGLKELGDEVALGVADIDAALDLAL